MTIRPATRALALAAALALPIGLAIASEEAAGTAAGETAAAAGGPPGVGTMLGTTMGGIATALEAEGHHVREIEREGGRFEVEIGRDGRGHELSVDAATGRVTKVERHD